MAVRARGRCWNVVRRFCDGLEAVALRVAGVAVARGSLEHAALVAAFASRRDVCAVKWETRTRMVEAAIRLCCRHGRQERDQEAEHEQQ